LICDGGDITSGTGKSLNFSGTGILQLDGNTANNVNVSSGDVHLESATDLTGMTIANDLRIDTGANSTLNFTGINVGGNVWNDSASNTLTINAVTSNITAGDAGTGNGETNIVNAVTVTITCVDISGTPIEDVRVYLKTTADGVIYNDLTGASGQISLSYNYTGDQALIESKARKGSASPYYKSAPISGTITSNGFDAVITMILDE
jgi:hypothetical protein